MSDLIPNNWRKSSYSGGQNSQCVEVAAGETSVGVRDSKDRTGGTLRFSAGSWIAFMTDLKAGRFNG
jgi:hypothetical protein